VDGSLFDLKNDSADDIAAAIVGNISETRRQVSRKPSPSG
jgi:hypothetical protein